MGTVKRAVNQGDGGTESGTVAGVWGSHDTLGIFKHKHVVAGCSDDVGSQFEANNLVQLQPKVVLFDRTVRKLINESSGMFLEGQNLLKSVSTVDTRVEVWKLSTLYRAIIHECLESLQKEVTSAAEGRRETCRHLVTVFYNIQFLWHLCEIVHFAVVPGSQVLPPLLDWIRFHMCEAEQYATRLLDAASRDQEWGGGEGQPRFWSTVLGLVLQGRSDVVRCLLHTHSLAGSQPFQQADVALRSWPPLLRQDVSMEDHGGGRSLWKRETLHKVHTGVFSSVPELELVMRIMCGEEQTFNTTKQYCDTWYQHMAAWLLYTDPNVKSFDLTSHAARSIALYGGVGQLTSVDRALIAILEADFTEVIKLAATLENGWFATHLTNLLVHSGLLETHDAAQSKWWAELEEGLLLQYGSLLMGHPSLWQVGASYLDHCPTRGSQRLALLLPRLPLHSELRAARVIEAARSRNLPAVEAGVCRVMAQRSLEQHQRPGNALAWALRSYDQDMISFLVDELLRNFLEHDQLQCLDLLDHLGCPPVLSDRLTFLVKYCEFRHIFMDGKNTEAAALLVDLLDSRLGPKFFWERLMSDVLPLLRCVVLGPEQTLTLLRVLQEMDGDDDKLRDVRAALNRNLGKAHVLQFSVKEEGDRIYI